MAGIITATINSMTKETPVGPVLQAATAKSLGYKTSTGISVDKTGTTYTFNIASGFTAAGFTGCDGEMILVSSTSGLNDGLYTLVSDTDTVLTVTEAVVTETAAAAGTVVIYGVAVYKIKPTRRTGQLLIIISEGIEAAGELGMIPCILNGDFWAAKNTDGKVGKGTTYTAFTATTVTDTTYYLWVETAPYMQDDAYIYVMLKPLATKQLYTDHRPALSVLELP